jgi:YegS/Rv2252/BmrU family lipid kinase
MTTLLVVNPAAGRGHAGRSAGDALAAARTAWGDTTVVETTAPGSAVGQVQAAVEAGAERVLVLGGDGTLHEAANGLLRAQVAARPPLGILAAGTGNDYAKMAGTAGLGAGAAVGRLARGRVRRFDVGEAWGEFFLNSIGIGFDAEVAREVNGMTWGRGLPAYLAAVATVITRFEAFDAEVTAPPHDFRDRLLLMEIGIGPCVGGGFRLTPHASPEDGLFDVCAIQRLSVAGILSKLPLAMLGRHTRLRQVRYFQATTLSIRAPAVLRAQFDGELRAAGNSMDVRIHPQALPVMIAE